MPLAQLMTETVSIDVDSPDQGVRGAAKSQPVVIATGIKVSVRAVPGSYTVPPRQAGQDNAIATHQVRFDAPLTWVDPIDGTTVRHDVDERCRIIWPDQASGRTRYLRPVSPSLHGRFTAQWLAYTVEVAQ